MKENNQRVFEDSFKKKGTKMLLRTTCLLEDINFWWKLLIVTDETKLMPKLPSLSCLKHVYSFYCWCEEQSKNNIAYA